MTEQEQESKLVSANLDNRIFPETQEDQNIAEEYFRKAIRIDPMNSDAHFNLSQLLQQNGQLIDAQLEFMQCIEIFDSHYRAYNSLGTIYVKRGLLTQAKWYFRRALEADPTYQEAQENLSKITSKKEEKYQKKNAKK